MPTRQLRSTYRYGEYREVGQPGEREEEADHEEHLDGVRPVLHDEVHAALLANRPDEDGQLAVRVEDEDLRQDVREAEHHGAVGDVEAVRNGGRADEHRGGVEVGCGEHDPVVDERRQPDEEGAEPRRQDQLHRHRLAHRTLARDGAVALKGESRHAVDGAADGEYRQEVDQLAKYSRWKTETLREGTDQRIVGLLVVGTPPAVVIAVLQCKRIQTPRPFL